MDEDKVLVVNLAKGRIGEDNCALLGAMIVTKIQLTALARAAVFGNLGTLISFRVGAEDARLLAREFYPTFGETDLVNLPNHSIHLKLLIDGAPSQPFSAVTLPPVPRKRSYRA
jgi:hypothetical protein